MKRFIPAIFAVCLFQSFGFGQIQNIQFKDMKGKSYDLYKWLEKGNYVFVEMIFNT